MLHNYIRPTNDLTQRLQKDGIRGEHASKACANIHAWSPRTLRDAPRVALDVSLLSTYWNALFGLRSAPDEIRHTGAARHAFSHRL